MASAFMDCLVRHRKCLAYDKTHLWKEEKFIIETEAVDLFHNNHSVCDIDLRNTNEHIILRRYVYCKEDTRLLGVQYYYLSNQSMWFDVVEPLLTSFILGSVT